MSAFCIEIKKESENDNMVLYKVNDVFNKDIFYVSIEPKCNLIKFYELDNLNNPILSIDYTNKKKPIGQPIKGHDEQTFVKTFINLYKAAMNNKFPDNLSYYA